MNDTQRWKLRKAACFAVIALAAVPLQLAVGVGAARASMDRALDDTPDIRFAQTTLNYNPATMLLTGSGYSLTLKADANPPYSIIHYPGFPEYAGKFSLQATIDNSGQLQTGPGKSNTLTFRGYVPQLSYNTGTILTGNITAFKSGGPDDVLEFLFDVTGGDAAALFGGLGVRAGLILAAANFPGSFSGPFCNSGAFGEVGNVVPEAASIVIWPLLGIAALGIERRRRRRSSAAPV